MSATIALHVPAKPVMVAARLKTAFERRGMQVLTRAQATPLSGFRLALVPAGPDGTWIHTDVPDALPDELGRVLSQDLRAPVTSVGRSDDLIAVEVAEAGRVTDRITARGAEVIDGGDGPLSAALARTGSLGDALIARGLADFGRTFDDAAGTPRTLVLGFAAKDGGGEEIEIDPGLSCPQCNEAMRRITGPHGVFYGCIRYPTCKGRLTEKQAAASR